MRSLSALLLVCFLPFVTPCSAQATDWQPFRWHMASLAGGPVERVGLLLPVKMNGTNCFVQLDTGVAEELIWSRQPPSPPPKNTPLPVLVELAGIRKTVSADPASLELLTPEVCAAAPIASVGNAFFEHGTLTLDLGRARFAFAPAPQLAGKAVAQPLFYARWTYSGGHPLVEVKLAGGKAGYALLDTGSVRFGLAATGLDEWNALSGGMPLEEGPRVKKFSVNSWGRQIQCYETTATGGVEVGGVALQQVTSYCAEHGFQSPVKLIGVLGLRPLGDRVVTLDYLSRRWTLSAAPDR
jgi:hypothetical protein